jgi:hypothetical protein
MSITERLSLQAPLAPEGLRAVAALAIAAADADRRWLARLFDRHAGNIAASGQFSKAADVTRLAEILRIGERTESVDDLSGQMSPPGGMAGTVIGQ